MRFIRGIRAALRPMVKELIKGGLVAMDAIAELAAETGEQLKDLVAEAKSEMAVVEEETSKDETDSKGPRANDRRTA